MIAVVIASWLGASPVFAEGTKIAVEADRISLFEVPLRCEAAPGIGCGGRSKPILLELEREPTITEAWLNGTGTLLAVLWTEGSSRESRTKAVQSVLERNGATAKELDGEARETMVAGEVIHEAAMGLPFHAKINDFIDLLHVYPTMSEALKIVAISHRKDPAKLSCCAE
jgi:hypothetical protein